MNSGSYPAASHYSMQAQKKKMLAHQRSGKSCGYYMRVVLFFSSLIQSLIIVSLVLFLVYGKQQDAAEPARIQDLEQSFQKLSLDNVVLRAQRKNLTTMLNRTMTQKMRDDLDLVELRKLANTSLEYILSYIKEISSLRSELTLCQIRLSKMPDVNPFMCRIACGPCEQAVAELELVRTNFTNSNRALQTRLQQVTRERDNTTMETITLRRAKARLQAEMDSYRLKCKEDFALSLRGISDVSKAFLKKIDSIFQENIRFQLTCPKQKEYLEQIRNNCTSLSREVEDKFQTYLDNVGARVSLIQAVSSSLEAENQRLSEDYRWCNHNRSNLVYEHARAVEAVQLRCDEAKERLLQEKRRLTEEKELQGKELNLKEKTIQELKRVSTLGTGSLGQSGFPSNRLQTGSSSSFSSSASNPSLFGLNKPASTGLGTSNTGSTGLGLNKPSSTGLGTSNTGSTGLGLNKPSSTGLGTSNTGSTGLGLNKPASTGLGTSNTGYTGLGLNRPASTGLGTSNTALGGAGAFGQGNRGTGTGLGTNSGLGTGSSLGGSGSSLGTGRSGVASSPGSVTVNQHIQELKKLANPSSKEEKKEPSRPFFGLG